MAFQVLSVLTRRNATHWGKSSSVSQQQREYEQLYGPIHKPLFLNKRIVVVEVPHSDKSVTIPLKECLRDAAVDSPLNTMLFLQPAYARSNECGHTYERSNETLTGIKVCYDRAFEHEIKLRMDTRGNSLAIVYAEVDVTKYDAFRFSVLRYYHAAYPDKILTVGWGAGARCQDCRGGGRPHRH